MFRPQVQGNIRIKKYKKEFTLKKQNSDKIGFG